MKRILHTDIVGQQGIHLIERVCLEMGFLWHPAGLEAGIDGYIEIRDSQSGEVTNCIVQVQSKATEQPLGGDHAGSPEYYCATKDLQYWLNGNAPVILVRSRPQTGEAYWISIKDYSLNRIPHPQACRAERMQWFDAIPSQRLALWV